MPGPANTSTAISPNLAAVATFEEAAPRYDSSGAQLAGPIADRLVNLASLRPGDQVLDIGCGAGAVAIRSARAVSPGGQVTGVDLSDGMLRRTAAEAAAQGLGNVTVRRGNASRPPFAPGSFDAALASLVLYLLPEPAVALRRWLEVLEPGGTVAFSWGIHPDPRWSPVFATVDAYAKGADGFEAHVRRLGSPEEMTTVLSDCGYSDIQISVDTVPVRYTGPRQWWQASWAEAPRLAWQHIPDADRAEARRAAFALLERMREPDGGLVRHVAMAYAIARRPPDSDDTGHGTGKAALR
jgi:ubiquinone/menaquinone biosynthesis C-methylase UbiE